MTFKRWHKIILISLISLLVTTLLLRGAIARLAFSIVSERVESRYGVKSSYSKLKIRGINGVEITNLALNSDGQDTLFKSGQIYVRINPVKLLLFKTDITYLELKGAALTFVKRDSTSNFDFLFKRSATTDTLATRSNTIAYSATLDKALSLLLRILPSEANIDDFKISYRRGEYSLEITIPSLKLKDDTYTTEIETVENGKRERLKVNGILNDDERRISSKIVGCDESGNSKGRFSVPFLDFRWGARVMFDSLAFDFTAGQRRGGVLILNGSSLFSGISLYHKRVSLDTVYLKKAQFEYKTLVGNNFIELDSASTATVNEITANPYLRAQKGEKWIVTASLNKEDFDSDQLFSSLPKGLFSNLAGIKTTGKLNYHFYTNIDLNNPDSLKLNSTLKAENFRITEFGATDFRYVNSEFDYTAYENGAPVKTILVGESNPNFKRLDEISEYLKICVLQSEDGGFFYHNGFLPESIREALIINIKDKKFRRGGSTISMQLVKNLFLSRSKTLSRKLEEMLIVWLIERNRLISKERMFEIYLNIIEWGPGIYGIAEASRFYFHKEPANLTINESIFLASIIPSPKRALRDLENYNLPEILNNGQIYTLKPGYEEYHKLLMSRLQAKGF
ncbi:MAG: transglycosylase domain-containing protein [Bacteroidales bacterium]